MMLEGLKKCEEDPSKGELFVEPFHNARVS